MAGLIEKGGFNEEFEAQHLFESFLATLSGQEIEIAHGAKVVTVVRPSAVRSMNTKPYLIEFLGFPGENPDVEEEPTIGRRVRERLFGRKEQNFVRIDRDTKRKYIYIDNAILQNKALKGKGVYQQVRRLLASHFPEGYTLQSQIINSRTRAQFIEVWTQVRRGEITADQARKMLNDHYWVKAWHEAGFNSVQLAFEDAPLFGDSVFMNRRKTPDGVDNFDVYFEYTKFPDKTS